MLISILNKLSPKIPNQFQFKLIHICNREDKIPLFQLRQYVYSIKGKMSINKYKEHKNIHHILTKWQEKREEFANAIFVTLGLKEFVILV